jgi:hypothetical protein
MKRTTAVISLALLAFCIVGEITAQSPEHNRVKAQLAELRKGKDVWTLPEYLENDFDTECEKITKEGKIVLVSIGREICGRCQVFYEFLKKGHIKIDSKKVVYLKLCIDNSDHKEYFLSTFEPPNNHLPFVGVVKGERGIGEPCLSGAQTPEAYMKIISDALKASK